MSKYLQEGKSENYQDAEARQLLKAGEVAALLAKKFKIKITAKELAPFATEWHHAGVFKTTSGRLKGKRVYFFNNADIEKIELRQILGNRKEERPVDNSIVQGWYMQYFKTTDPTSRKIISKSFIGIYKGTKSKAPKGLIQLTDEKLEEAQKQKGRELKPGEKCVF